jgi:predicted small lipoprotein YifL
MKKKLLLGLHALAALMLTLSFSACGEKGPAEKTGENADEAAEDGSDDDADEGDEDEDTD